MYQCIIGAKMIKLEIRNDASAGLAKPEGANPDTS
ncbi:Uncharacterised protein [uncultured archaeon]|nr:Uncharacterised protein [uncultured archaeon]